LAFQFHRRDYYSLLQAASDILDMAHWSANMMSATTPTFAPDRLSVRQDYATLDRTYVNPDHRLSIISRCIPSIAALVP
jgi:hypothetical protein